jgi:hypothetical protein
MDNLEKVAAIRPESCYICRDNSCPSRAREPTNEMPALSICCCILALIKEAHSTLLGNGRLSPTEESLNAFEAVDEK